MIQACIMVNHIIHGKVWNCRIQVFSKLVESALGCHALAFDVPGSSDAFTEP